MKKVHIVLFPMLAHGHMIPCLDMAKVFVSNGCKATLITTQAYSDPITKAQESGHGIDLRIIKFPPEGSSLPENITGMDQVEKDTLMVFIDAMEMLQVQFELILQELRPDCIVSDMFLHWTVDSAAKFGIPRLVFHGISYIGLCCGEAMEEYKPFVKVSSDEEPFLLPHLPHELYFYKTQVSPFSLQDNNSFSEWDKKMNESEKKSYGVLVNSFHELELDYEHHYTKVLSKKAWGIGPLLLCNKQEKSIRGKAYAIHEDNCLKWLHSKPLNSVIYICFGSIASFSSAQLTEMAKGIEDSGQNFIWVLRKSKDQMNEKWLPQGFEERTRERGLIIRGWAPQVLILNHSSIGAFMTHCGWNSTLEGICAGVPFVTWPVFAEQFYNEKLIVDVLKTGVSVGSRKWMWGESEGVAADAVSWALRRVLDVGCGAAEMRQRGKHYQKMAVVAVEEGGSSYNKLNEFIVEMRDYKH